MNLKSYPQICYNNDLRTCYFCLQFEIFIDYRIELHGFSLLRFLKLILRFPCLKLYYCLVLVELVVKVLQKLNFLLNRPQGLFYRRFLPYRGNQNNCKKAQMNRRRHHYHHHCDRICPH